MHDKIKILIAEALGIEISDVDENSLLREDLGLEPTDLTNLILAIKEEYRTSVGPKDLEKVKTLEDLIELIENNSEQ